MAENDVEIAAMLLLAGADPNQKFIHEPFKLVGSGLLHPLEIERMQSRGYVVTLTRKPVWEPAVRSTSLHLAVQEGNKELVQLLLEQGADPGEADSAGVTPRMRATSLGRAEISELLEKST